MFQRKNNSRAAAADTANFNEVSGAEINSVVRRPLDSFHARLLAGLLVQNSSEVRGQGATGRLLRQDLSAAETQQAEEEYFKNVLIVNRLLLFASQMNDMKAILLSSERVL
jgi:hypothetical protein